MTLHARRVPTLPSYRKDDPERWASSLLRELRTLFRQVYDSFQGSIRHLHTSSVIDLSGASTTEYILHTPTGVSIDILSITVTYTEASSADSGIKLEFGKESDRDYFGTYTTESSKAQYYETEVTLSNTTLNEGDTLTVYSPGSKTGAGEVIVTFDIEYHFE